MDWTRSYRDLMGDKRPNIRWPSPLAALLGPWLLLGERRPRMIDMEAKRRAAARAVKRLQ